jgi:hypothetical protein
MVTFHNHPASRIARNLEGYCKEFTEEKWAKISKSGSFSQIKDLSQKVDLMLIGNRTCYRRTRGCASRVIDIVANVNGIPSSEIILPGVHNVLSVVKSRSRWLIRKEEIFSKEEGVILGSRIKSLSQNSVELGAVQIEALTNRLSLCPYFFHMNDSELSSYLEYRKQGILVSEHIIKYYPHGILHKSMVSIVNKDYTKLLKYFDNDPDCYIDDLCMRIRQQILDGNTLFTNYKRSIELFIMMKLKNVLIDYTRRLEQDRKKNRIIQNSLSSENHQFELVSTINVDSSKHNHWRDLVLESILSIPCQQDKKILHSVFDGESDETINYGIVRNSLIRWSPLIVSNLGGRIQELPIKWQHHLRWCCNDKYITKQRDILELWQLTKEKGLSATWLAGKLQIPLSVLMSLIHGQSFPKNTIFSKPKHLISEIKTRLAQKNCYENETKKI